MWAQATEESVRTLDKHRTCRVADNARIAEHRLSLPAHDTFECGDVKECGNTDWVCLSTHLSACWKLNVLPQPSRQHCIWLYHILFLQCNATAFLCATVIADGSGHAGKVATSVPTGAGPTASSSCKSINLCKRTWQGTLQVCTLM